MATEKLLFSAREAAELLSVSDRTLWEYTVPRGPIPYVRFGNRVLYDRQSLETGIKRMRHDAENGDFDIRDVNLN